MAPSSPPPKKPQPSASPPPPNCPTALCHKAPPERKKRKPPTPGKTSVEPASKKHGAPRLASTVAPPPPPLPEASGATQPPANRKPALFQRKWSPDDEVRILEALAMYRQEHGGSLPTGAELFRALDGSLDKKGVGPKELGIKQRSFKRRYDRDAKKTVPPADEHERRLYFLSKHVWGRDLLPKPPVAEVPRVTQEKGAGAQASMYAAQAKSAGHQSSKEAVKPKAKTLDEMRQLYPYLVDEATVLVEPAVLESLLLGIENSDAQVLDKKIRKARKQLAKAIKESARITNMEIPTVFMFTSEKLRVENENNLLVDHLDKTDDMDSCTKQRLARVEREVLELRQAVIASQSQPKGIRCESAKSGLQSIVAENQTPANILQKKIEAPNGNNVEVTSKYYCGVPKNVPPTEPKIQAVMLPPFNAFPGMPRKIVKKGPTPCRATCRGGHMLSRF